MQSVYRHTRMILFVVIGLCVVSVAAFLWAARTKQDLYTVAIDSETDLDTLLERVQCRRLRLLQPEDVASGQLTIEIVRLQAYQVLNLEELLKSRAGYRLATLREVCCLAEQYEIYVRQSAFETGPLQPISLLYVSGDVGIESSLRKGEWEEGTALILALKERGNIDALPLSFRSLPYEHAIALVKE